MPEPAWKVFERRVARRLGGKRIPVQGDRAGADAETPLLCIQAKIGRRMPGYLGNWLAGICQTALAKRKFGLVVWKALNVADKNAVVIMRLGDFEQLHGRLPRSEGKGQAVALPEQPEPNGPWAQQEYLPPIGGNTSDPGAK